MAYQIGQKTYFKGDEVEIVSTPYAMYGGEFQNATRLSDGKRFCIATPEQVKRNADEAISQWKKQQAGFKRLRELE